MQSDGNCDYSLPQHFSDAFKRKLWSWTVKNSGTIPESNPELGECWIWTGSTNPNGYGQITCGNNKRINTYRAVWIITNGPIPKGHNVLHKCDNPWCVRPDHLFTGTQKENLDDMRQKGRDRGCAGVGEKNHFCKLSETEVVRLRYDHATGAFTYRKLGEKYGIAAGHVCLIIKRKVWKHVI